MIVYFVRDPDLAIAFLSIITELAPLSVNHNGSNDGSYLSESKTIDHLSQNLTLFRIPQIDTIVGIGRVTDNEPNLNNDLELEPAHTLRANGPQLCIPVPDLHIARKIVVAAGHTISYESDQLVKVLGPVGSGISVLLINSNISSSTIRNNSFVGDMTKTLTRFLNNQTIPQLEQLTPDLLPVTLHQTSEMAAGPLTLSNVPAYSHPKSQTSSLSTSPEKFDNGELIPSLSLSILSEGQYRILQPNSSRPTRFVTDIFDGEVLVMVNTRNINRNNNGNTPRQGHESSQRQRYEKRFTGTTLTFDVQVQGRFLTCPAGPIYVGAEITRRMNLSMLTRSMCGSILQLGRRSLPSMHSSFGDPDNRELPHITSPLWSTVDRLVITSPGDIPPVLGEVLPEPDDKRAERKKLMDPYAIEVSLDDTYSFSVSTSFLDLTTWKAVNLPVLNAISLQTFWGDADLRLCVYALPIQRTDPLPKMHPQATNKYCFSVEVRHSSNHPEWVDQQDLRPEPIAAALGAADPQKSPVRRSKIPHPDDGGVEEADSDVHTLKRLARASSYKHESESESPTSSHIDEVLLHLERSPRGRELNAFVDDSDDGNNVDDDDRNSVDTSAFFDARESASRAGAPSSSTSSRSNKELRLNGPPLFVGTDKDAYGSSGSHTRARASSDKRTAADPYELIPEPHFLPVNWVFRCLRNEYVRAVFEMPDQRMTRRQTQGRRTLYAFILSPGGDPSIHAALNLASTSIHSSSRLLNKGPDLSLRDNFSRACSPNGSEVPGVALRSFQEWRDEGLPLLALSEPPACFARKSESEERRMVLEFSYSVACFQAHQDEMLRAKLRRFLGNDKHTSTFLQGPTTKISGFNLNTQGLASSVAIQQGQNQWSGESMSVSVSQGADKADGQGGDLVFARPGALGQTKRMRVPLATIRGVRAVSAESCGLALAGVHGLVVDTFARQYTVLLRGDPEEWIKSLMTFSATAMSNISSFPRTPGSPRLLLGSVPPSTSVPNSVAARVRLGLSRIRARSGSSDTQATAHVTRAALDTEGATATDPASHPSPSINMLDMLARPRGWRLGNRVILNNRSFVASCCPLDDETRNSPYLPLLNQPCALVEALLERALELSRLALAHDNPTGAGATAGVGPHPGLSSKTLGPTQVHGDDSTVLSAHAVQLWTEFLVGVCLLQRLDPSGKGSGGCSRLSQEESLCLRLNLYHCLLLHAALVVGPPQSALKWPGFFFACSYEAFGDIFSLAELDHCVIKAGCPRPSMNLVLQSLLPTARYDITGAGSTGRSAASAVVQAGDGMPPWRLLWAVNPGSVSYLPWVPVFTADQLDSQLDAIIRQNIRDTQQLSVTVDPVSGAGTVLLPTLCHWYAKWFDRERDLTRSGEHSATHAPGERRKGHSVLMQLLPYCGGETKILLATLLASGAQVTLKYAAFSYRCRLLLPWPVDVPALLTRPSVSLSRDPSQSSLSPIADSEYNDGSSHHDKAGNTTPNLLEMTNDQLELNIVDGQFYSAHSADLDESFS